eukprot:3013846-Amphidinium_carterae.1
MQKSGVPAGVEGRWGTQTLSNLAKQHCHRALRFCVGFTLFLALKRLQIDQSGLALRDPLAKTLCNQR